MLCSREDRTDTSEEKQEGIDSRGNHYERQDHQAYREGKAP
jgi:hypothetical protein